MSKPEVIEAPENLTPLPRASRKRKRLLLLFVVPAIVVVTGLGFYLTGGRYVETDNAYVKARKVPVSAEVSGMVKAVMVRENQHVAAGAPLFKLDSAPYEVAVAKAEAKLAQARTDFAALQASYREKQAEIALARTRYAFAKSDEKRQTELGAKAFVSASALDTARQNAELAEQQIVTLQQDLHRIAESMGGDAESQLENYPGYLVAMAELRQARLDLSRVVVRASLPGTVTLPPNPGEYVSAGKTVMALVAGGDHWIEANFPETDLTFVKPGQSVRVNVDTYPDTTWKGVVESLSPATGAEFSLIPAQNATGNWVKITQRVPVRIRLDEAAGQPRLRAGLSAIVEIDTGHRRRLLGLTM
jgi:membrane fusion protein, multidrug efflux system